MAFHVKVCFCDSSRPLPPSINRLEIHITVVRRFLFTNPSCAPTASLVLSKAWSWPWKNRAWGENGSHIFQNYPEHLWNQLRDLKPKMFLIFDYIFQQLTAYFSPYHFLTPFNLSIFVSHFSFFFLYLSWLLSFSFPFLTPFTFLHHVFSLFTSSSLPLRNLHIQNLIHRTPAQERILVLQTWHQRDTTVLPTPPTQGTEFRKRIPSSYHLT